MSEWWLPGLFIVITCLAGLGFVYPLKQRIKWTLILMPLILLFTTTAYLLWGGFPQWQKYLHQQQAQLRVQKILASIKSPQELIVKLQARLREQPQSAKGWYLLGRLYSSQQEDKPASLAFAKAYALKPANELYAVHYAHSLWQVNQQQFNPQIVRLFEVLLKNNPNQPDALAMLAMDAFLNHVYEKAIAYWQRLLQQTPASSEEALVIQKAIVKAQQYVLKESGAYQGNHGRQAKHNIQ